MRRRIAWKYGDSPPLYGHLIAAVEGSGLMYVATGFPVSAAEVAFSKEFNQSNPGPFSYNYLPLGAEVYVDSVDDGGFTIAYNNVDSLEVNYFVM